MKMIAESIRLAFVSLWHNRGRTILSMLGIIIGVASVIIITSIGSSASNSVKKQIESVGLNTISVFPGKGEREAARLSDFALAEKIQKQFPDFDTVLPTQRTSATLTYGKYSSDVTVMGVFTDFASVFSYSAASGSFFSDSDYERRKNVVVLGSDVAEDLFPDGDAIGKYVRLFRDVPVRLKVVGVMESRSDTIGISFDSSVFVPYSTYISSIENTDVVGMYIVNVKDGADVVNLASELEDYLVSIAGDNSEAFRVVSAATIADMYSQVTDTLSLLLGGVAAISLIVGGIGIMNIMLVSVTERTREIGIRKAMGASPFFIRLQFLIESVVLTITGGFIGLIMGVLISWGITLLFSWDFSLNLFALAASFVFAFAVGVFFGFYPAYKASRLDPVKALAFE
ncbi:ABC transporter permease [Spirochaetia bacterium 38H-sp]|uniref:ABC transporter permease n=1 Tax=Rarispira pelagica TaxID=3141764 RepID=A0ABU9UDV6_9SPIR